MPNRIALIALALLIPGLAHAYDEDTHFYGTYAMARHAGIKHEVAMKIALSAQWMDESYISDPMSMKQMPASGVKKRRLLHFPSSRINVGATEAEKAIFGLSDLGEFGDYIEGKVAKAAGVTKEEIERMRLIGVTEEDDPMASQMLFEGITEGNLLKAATGLHTLEDSFAHAGTPAGSGHAMWWHWPDRPYGSQEKYTRMVNSVMSAMVGIRTLLPREALDCNLKTAAPRNCEADQQVLTETYLPLIMPVISHDMLRDPDYVKVALKEFYTRSVEAKYMLGSDADFAARVDALKLVDGKTNSYNALSQIFINDLNSVADGKNSIFDYSKILVDMGRVNSADSVKVLEVVERYGVNGVKNWKEDARVRFAKVVALEMLAWHVPLDMSDSHRMEFEQDKDEVRKFEMEKRINNMQAFIRKNFGTDIEFIGNNSNDERGFYQELHLDPHAEPSFSQREGFKPRPGAVYATFSLKEKDAFDRMVMHYLFPSMSAEDVMSVVEGIKKMKTILKERSDYYAELKVIEDNKDSSWITKRYEAAKLDIKYRRFRGVSWNKVKFIDIALNEVYPKMVLEFHDVFHTHLHGDEKVFVYRRDENFQKYIKEKDLKPFLGEKDFWKLQELMAPPASPLQPAASFWNSIF